MNIKVHPKPKLWYFFPTNAVEADLVYLPTEEYSNYCESPSATSRIAPHFKFNNISLNSDTVNEFYQANVTRGSSLDGRHRATLALTALGSTLNGSTVTCLINHSTVIWRVHLITIGTFSAIILVYRYMRFLYHCRIQGNSSYYHCCYGV